jgi:hypothetical protein
VERPNGVPLGGLNKPRPPAKLLRQALTLPIRQKADQVAFRNSGLVQGRSAVLINAWDKL